MQAGEARKRLLSILDNAPALKEIFVSSDPLEAKREKIRALLSSIIVTTFEHGSAVQPLEWILTRNAVRAFRRILSLRGEELARFGLLQYLDDIIRENGHEGLEVPTAAFLAEIEHLLKGVMGTAGIYPHKIPSFLKYGGTKAALMRSDDLSAMARTAQAFIGRYPCGLDPELVDRCHANSSRIREYLGGTEREWGTWQWQTRHSIRDLETLASLIELSAKERQGVELAREHGVPFAITPYYLSLMDRNATEADRALRAQVIPTPYYVRKLVELREQAEASQDFMLERDTSPIEGVTRRYPQVAIIKPILTCPQVCVYCQRNWELKGDMTSAHSMLDKQKLDEAIGWLETTPEINEVLITGGDPFLLSDKKLGELLSRIANIAHVQRIRVGTRMLVTLPQRITESLAKTLSRFHEPGRREVIVITHFEHLAEITPEAMAAAQRIRRAGIEICNQLVYTFYNSRKFEAAALRHKLRLIGVVPYYTFSTKGKEETDDFRVPVARLLQERDEEARLLPGTVRTDTYVFNVPRLGKNDLAASQNHDVISILPDGRRVYEFHPWEKKLSLVDTFIYTDVSIYDYLQRLKACGEDVSNYKTIWYYY